MLSLDAGVNGEGSAWQCDANPSLITRNDHLGVLFVLSPRDVRLHHLEVDIPRQHR